MLGSRQQVQSDNNTSNVNADDNAIAIDDNDDDDDSQCASPAPVPVLLLHTFRRDMLYVSGQQKKLRIRHVCNAKLVTSSHCKNKKMQKKRVSPAQSGDKLRCDMCCEF